MVIMVKDTASNAVAKKTLRHVWYGIWIIAAAVCLCGVWFVDNPLSYIAGEVVGSLIASLLMLHLYHCIDVELEMQEGKAVAHSRWNGILRTMVEVASVASCFFVSDWINPFTLLAGLFGRKFAAMLVPLLFERERNGEMTPEDKAEFEKYGRLLGKKEKEEIEEKEEL